MAKSSKIFISYSKEEPAHNQRVLNLANKLREHGQVVWLDQYEQAPADGWPAWMRRCIVDADYVLMVCTRTYNLRIQGKAGEGEGLGVFWEGDLLDNLKYRKKQNRLTVPLLFAGSTPDDVPLEFQGLSRFEIKAFSIQDPGYLALYRLVSEQPETVAPEVGQVIVLSTNRAQTGVAPTLSTLQSFAAVPPQAIAARASAVGPEAGAGVAVPPQASVAVGVEAKANRSPKLFKFRLVPSDNDPNRFNVELTCPGSETVEVPFACDPFGERQTKEALEKIARGDCVRDDLAFVGSQLWDGMVHGTTLTRVDDLRKADPEAFFHVRLRLPRALNDLPWEALYDPLDSFLSTSERYCVIRDVPDLPGPADQADAPRGDRPVDLLIVLPAGSQLDLATERAWVQKRAGRQGDAVHVEVLEGKVTADTVREALERGKPDVVHFAGHARVSDKGEVQIRLNGGDEPDGERWLDGEAFATLFNRAGVRLVVLNCCRSASHYTGTGRGSSGLGPLLLHKGVGAVVAMRYDLSDPTALRFADEFYRVLFAGAEPGRVDLSMEKARVVIFQNQTDRTVRDFVTPALFLAPGRERAFVLPTPPDPPPDPLVGSIAADPAAASAVPDDLRTAFLEGRLVPVIGPGLLVADALRGEGTTPGPRELAWQLANESTYNGSRLFELAPVFGGWFDSLLLQWVCQHFYRVKTRRIKLYESIQKTFRPLKPPPLVRAVAAWNAPGFVCTFFDGLLQQAIQDLSRPVQVINTLQNNVAPEPGAILLVHLRGNWSDVSSLVLTEEHHNDLWDCLSKLPDRVAGLAFGGIGRSLLFLGVDPRDPLARRLASKMIPKDRRETVGPVYFAATSPSDDDRAYWEAFETQWLDQPLGGLVAALTAGARPEATP